MLYVRAGRVWTEMWAGGARACAEPFLHVGLVLVLGGLVFEYVGNLADLLVIGLGDVGALYWGAAGDAERVPVEAVLVGCGCWCTREMGAK